jgi:hypothetical protein
MFIVCIVFLKPILNSQRGRFIETACIEN